MSKCLLPNLVKQGWHLVNINSLLWDILATVLLYWNSWVLNTVLKGTSVTLMREEDAFSLPALDKKPMSVSLCWTFPLTATGLYYTHSFTSQVRSTYLDVSWMSVRLIDSRCERPRLLGDRGCCSNNPSRTPPGGQQRVTHTHTNKHS